jgi:hypothetical protein
VSRWVPFAGGDYAISDDGRVQRLTHGRRTFAGRMLKLTPKTCGYLKVSPVILGKNVHFYVHDLVAEAFIGPKPEGAEVNHKDGNKHNNWHENLEYVTHLGNMQHAAATGLMVSGERHPGVKLSDADVRNIRARRLRGDGVTSMAREYGVSPALVCNITKGNRRAS